MDKTLLARCPITGGTVVGVLGRHFGLWSLNARRIVYVIEEQASLLRRYGFTFGTLPGHVERARNASPWSGTVRRARCGTRYSPSPARPTR